jgi:hypothetical protein
LSDGAEIDVLEETAVDEAEVDEDVPPTEDGRDGDDGNGGIGILLLLWVLATDCAVETLGAGGTGSARIGAVREVSAL